LAGWWDAGSYAGLVDSNGVPIPAWNNPVGGVSDKSSVGNALSVYHYATATASPQATPRLNGQLGGVGLNTVAPPGLPSFIPASGYVLPQMDLDTGFSLASGAIGAGAGWTVYMVWSRPNWAQGYGAPTSIALLTSGTNVILAADAQAGSNTRLILFPGSSQTVLTTSLERRHTHSIIIANAPGAGVSVWLDGTQVAQAASNALPSTVSGSLLFLHSGQGYGSAQCWFHEAAIWHRALAGSDIDTLLSCATRWTRGPRKGIQILVMGQSNAGYQIQTDRSWHVMAQGIAWHLGAIAYGIIGNWGSSGTATCLNGHGISNEPFGTTDATATFQSSFLQDPGDGSDPAGWVLGPDGEGVAYVLGPADTAADDLTDLVMIVWPWTETDSIRPYSDKTYYEHAQVNLLGKLRAMASRSAASLPLMLWNAIPYGSGSTGGMQMVREAAFDLAGTPSENAFIGLPQTSDSNPRGGTWNEVTGAFTPYTGDPSHRDTIDNVRFGRLAAPVAARAILAATGADIETSIPAGIPVIGGPYISHVYQAIAHSTTIILTITHDAGTDLVLGLQAATGVGFCVMDGGSVASPGNIIAATACARIDATHLQITLASAPTNAQSGLLFFYCYGPGNLYRGNAVYDNFSTRTPPAGWDIAGDLGSAWSLNYPLAATTTPLVVSPAP
jgi:hypothetical protein